MDDFIQVQARTCNFANGLAFLDADGNQMADIAQFDPISGRALKLMTEEGGSLVIDESDPENPVAKMELKPVATVGLVLAQIGLQNGRQKSEMRS